MKKQSMFGGMSAIEVMRYINGDGDNSENNNERCFSEEVFGSKTAKEIADFFRKKELKGEKGWKLISTDCEYSRERENYMCPLDYYIISARFRRVG